MCGFVGKFEFNGAIQDPSELIKATESLIHRGPDEGNYWWDKSYFLGHRRLSIIGLHDGSQPMASHDNRYVLVFNGEIYNYIELRDSLKAEGFEFKTSSDTEVIIHGYKAWGKDLPKKLSGMFAFAIIDRVKHSVFLARDRFGEKPLFIVNTGQGITFASELKAITQLSYVHKSYNLEAVSQYLCLNYVPLNKTLIKNIERLPAASWVYYEGSKKTFGKYWELPEVDEQYSGSISSSVETLKSKLDNSVKLTLRSDVPVTLMLSGGIDSALVAESAARQGKIKTAYCLDFEDQRFSEKVNAQFVADKLGIELRTVTLAEQSIEKFLEMAKYADDPIGDSSSLPVWTLCQGIKDNYKVAISGDGGDELFGGYLTYRATNLYKHLSKILPSQVRHALGQLSTKIPMGSGKVSLGYKMMRFLRAFELPPEQAHYAWNGSLLPSEVKHCLVGDSNFNPLANLAEEHQLNPNSTINDYQRMDTREYLANDILVKVDRMAMAHGLESRAPLLNHDLANFAAALPQKYKLKTFGKSKVILREYANKLFGPQIAYAKKQGFSLPIHGWLRGKASFILEDLLSIDSLKNIPMLNSDYIVVLRDQHLQGKQQLGYELWGLMVLVYWHKTHFNNYIQTSQSTLCRKHFELLKNTRDAYA